MPVATSTHVPALAQHGIDVLQSWPSCWHVPTTPHVPVVWPAWNTHVAPLQQSEVCEHMPLVLMHVVPAHTPFTHGSPLQQSSEFEHVWPALRHIVPTP